MTQQELQSQFDEWAQTYDAELQTEGFIVAGDIAFPTTNVLHETRRRAGEVWDEEYYWLLGPTCAALEPAGWRVGYQQISFCAAVYTFSPPKIELGAGGR